MSIFSKIKKVNALLSKASTPVRPVKDEDLIQAYTRVVKANSQSTMRIHEAMLIIQEMEEEIKEFKIAFKQMEEEFKSFNKVENGAKNTINLKK
jgi:hypothetical protein